MITLLKKRIPVHTAYRKFYCSCLLATVGLCFGTTAIAQDSTAKPVDSAPVTSTATLSTNTHAASVRALNSPVYKMNYWVTGGFCVLATAGNLYAIPNILHGKKDIPVEELQRLVNIRNNDRGSINGFDRWVLNQDPSKRGTYKQASDFILPAVILSGGILAFDKSIRQDWLKILLMYYETQAATFTLYNFSPLGPAFQNRYRPFLYYDYFSAEDRKGGNGKNSFFSGHTANVAAATFFMAKVYSDYHPEIGGKKYLLYGLAAIPPLVEGYIRVKALEHFTSDVAAGFVIGAITGIVIPSLHKIKNPNLQVGMSYSGTGPGVNVKWKIHKNERKLLTTHPVALTAIKM